MDSVFNQTFRNWRIFVCCDTIEAYNYAIAEQIGKALYPSVIIRNSNENHFWNLYCNELKKQVDDGWFFYLDDDDYLHNQNSLANIAKYLTNPDEGVICQFLRNGKPKPRRELMEAGRIEKGRIGAPCLFLHHSKKDIANWDGQRAADFRWIKDVEKQLPLKFVQVVVVEAGNNGLHGK